MQKIFRSALLIVAAMVICAAVLAALIAIATSLTVYGSRPADLLPADTRAVLHHIDEETTSAWQQAFPSLAEAKRTTIAAAVLATENGAEGSVFFANAQPESERVVGKYALDASDFLLYPLVQTQDASLSKKTTYATFVRRIRHDAPWVFIAEQARQNYTTLFERLVARMIAGKGDIAIRTDGPSGIVEQYSNEAPTVAANLEVPSIPNSALTLLYANGKTSLESTMHLLSTSDTIILEGILNGAVQSISNDLTIQAHILPLIDNPGSLHITASGGITHVLLAGTVDDKKTLETLLDNIHTAYMSKLPTSHVTKRVLDKRFSSVDIRHDPTSIEDWSNREGAWVVRSVSGQESSDGLFSAVDENRFLLSNNKDVLLHAMNHTETLPIPRYDNRDILVGGLRADLTRALPLLRRYLPGQVPNIGTGTLLLGSYRNGITHSTVFSIQGNATKLLDSIR